MFSETDSLEEFVTSLSHRSLMSTVPGEPPNSIVIDSTALNMVRVKLLRGNYQNVPAIIVKWLLWRGSNTCACKSKM